MDSEKKFKILSNITRASHFEWRRAALKLNPHLDPIEVVKAYWCEVAQDTAQYYLKQIDPSQDLTSQVAELFVSSSLAMGEEAEVLSAMEKKTSGIKHLDCPWYHWHKRLELLEEDQVGCDMWFEVVLAEINKALGCNLKFKTQSSLPAGDASCRRIIWEDSLDNSD